MSTKTKRWVLSSLFIAYLIGLLIYRESGYEFMKGVYLRSYLVEGAEIQQYDAENGLLIRIVGITRENRIAICIANTKNGEDLCFPLRQANPYRIEVALSPAADQFAVLYENMDVVKYDLNGTELTVFPAKAEKESYRWNLNWTESGISWTGDPEKAGEINTFGNQAIYIWDGESDKVRILSKTGCDLDEFQEIGGTSAYHTVCGLSEKDGYYTVTSPHFGEEVVTTWNYGKLVSPTRFIYQFSVGDTRLQALDLPNNFYQIYPQEMEIGQGDFASMGDMVAWISYSDANQKGVYYYNLASRKIQYLNTPEIDFDKDVFNLKWLNENFLILGRQGDKVLDIYKIP
jgi:hypothetical protein